MPKKGKYIVSKLQTKTNSRNRASNKIKIRHNPGTRTQNPEPLEVQEVTGTGTDPCPVISPDDSWSQKERDAGPDVKLDVESDDVDLDPDDVKQDDAKQDDVNPNNANQDYADQNDVNPDPDDANLNDVTSDLDDLSLDDFSPEPDDMDQEPDPDSGTSDDGSDEISRHQEKRSRKRSSKRIKQKNKNDQVIRARVLDRDRGSDSGQGVSRTLTPRSQARNNASNIVIKKKTDIMENDIFENIPNPAFHQPFEKKENDNYIKICDSMLARLCTVASGAQVHDTVAPGARVSDTLVPGVPEAPDPEINSTEHLVQSMINDINKIKLKFQQIIDIGKCFNKRDIMISAFANTAHNIMGIFPATKGDFDRKCLECPHALENLFGDNIYGNPIGSNINFVFNGCDAINIILYVDKLRATTERPINRRLVFGSYRLDKVYRDDIIIRSESSDPSIRYALIMTDIETGISIKNYVVNQYVSSNVRVQSLDYCGEKIFEAIPDLVLRRAIRGENLTKRVKKLIETMEREQRQSIWEDILNVLDHDIRYLDQGYDVLDIGDNKMIKFSIEKKEPCSITMIQAPYMKVHLACNHELSLMAIYGIIYAGKSDDTESILCPICRYNLIPKLVPALSDSDAGKYIVTAYKDKDLKSEIVNDDFKFENINPITNIVQKYDESEKFIDQIFKRRDDDQYVSDEDDDSFIAMRDDFIDYLTSLRTSSRQSRV
jgi:hypothetical protein